MGVQSLHGLWIAFVELTQRLVVLLDHLVKIIYRGHEGITSIVETLSFP